MEIKERRYNNVLRYLIAGMPKTSFAAIVIVFACAIFRQYLSTGQHLFICIGMLIICGYEIAIGAVQAILNKRYLHRDVYQTVAILGTFVIGMYYEAIVAAAVFAICRTVINTIIEWTEHRFEVVSDDDVLLESKKSSLEKKINGSVAAFSAISLIVIIALTIIVPLVWRVQIMAWLRRAFILFAAACPGAVGISAGIEYYKCLNTAYTKRIRYTSRDSIEKCSYVTSVVFGKIELVSSKRYDIEQIEPNNITKSELLLLAAYGCSFSDDEIFRTIVTESGVDVDLTKVDMYKNFGDRGTAVMLGNVKLLAGDAEFISEYVADFEETFYDNFTVYVAANGKYAGKIKVKYADDGDYSETMKKLKAAELDRVVLLTSTPLAQAQVIADKLGIGETWADLNFEERQEKLHNIREMQIDDERVAFVAESAEDAKLIETADVGITVGEAASVIKADVNIRDDNHANIADIFIMSRTLVTNIRRNLKLSCVLKILTIFIALLGYSGIWTVAVIDTIAMALVLKGRKGSKY